MNFPSIVIQLSEIVACHNLPAGSSLQWWDPGGTLRALPLTLVTTTLKDPGPQPFGIKQIQAIWSEHREGLYWVAHSVPLKTGDYKAALSAPSFKRANDMIAEE